MIKQKMYFFDRIIQVVLYQKGSGEPDLDDPLALPGSLVIDSSLPGPKPDVSLEIGELPGGLCYQMTLKIRNFQSRVDVRTFDRCLIIAGYKKAPEIWTTSASKGGKYTFKIFERYNMDIFSAWVDKPNPNGTVTFLGITVGYVGDNKETDNTVVEFHPEYWKQDLVVTGQPAFKPDTVRNFLQWLQFADKSGFATKEGGEIEFEIYLPKAYLDDTRLEAFAGRQTFHGMGHFLGWLKMILTPVVILHNREAKEKDPDYQDDTLSIYYWDRKIYIVSLRHAELKQEGVLLEPVHNVDGVRSVQFQGPACTIRSVWNPNVHPGSVISIDAKYYEGGVATNMYMPPSSYQSPSLRYRVITVNIQFATVQNINEMTVLCMQIETFNEDKGRNPNAPTIEDMVEVQRQRLEESNEISRHIVFGRPLSEASGQPDATTDTLSSLDWPDTVFYITQAGPHTINGKSVSQGDHVVGWNQIARCWFRDQVILCSMLKGFVHPDTQIEFDLQANNYIKIIDAGCLWPLLVQMTLARKGQTASSNIKYQVDMTNLDNVQVPWAVCVPAGDPFWWNWTISRDTLADALEEGAAFVLRRANLNPSPVNRKDAQGTRTQLLWFAYALRNTTEAQIKEVKRKYPNGYTG